MGLFPFLNVVIMEVVSILNKSRKLFLKNKKMMFSVLVLLLLLKSLVFLFNEKFVGSSYIFMAVSSIINFCSVIVIVHASALTLKNEKIKITYFLVLTLKSWKGPLVTYFYVGLCLLGYGLVFGVILVPLSLFSSKLYSLVTKSVALFVILEVYGAYLSIVWNLSMVVSILEETYGIKALRKAAKIVKGMKPKLFLLNLSFCLLSLGLNEILQLINWRRSLLVTLTTGLLFALWMFQLVTYTVVYFQCTSLLGKDVESLGNVEYTKLSSMTLMG